MGMSSSKLEREERDEANDEERLNAVLMSVMVITEVNILPGSI